MQVNPDTQSSFDTYSALQDREDKHRLVAQTVSQVLKDFVSRNKEALAGAEYLELPCLPGDDAADKPDHKRRSAVIRQCLETSGFKVSPLMVSKYVRNERYFLRIDYDGQKAREARVRSVEAQVHKALSNGLEQGACHLDIKLPSLSLELAQERLLAELYAKDDVCELSESGRTRVDADFTRLRQRITDVVRATVKALCAQERVAYRLQVEANQIHIEAGEHKGPVSYCQRRDLVRDGYEGTESIGFTLRCC